MRGPLLLSIAEKSDRGRPFAVLVFKDRKVIAYDYAIPDAKAAFEIAKRLADKHQATSFKIYFIQRIG